MDIEIKPTEWVLPNRVGYNKYTYNTFHQVKKTIVSRNDWVFNVGSQRLRLSRTSIQCVLRLPTSPTQAPRFAACSYVIDVC